jgi:hypothetical protein
MSDENKEEKRVKISVIEETPEEEIVKEDTESSSENVEAESTGEFEKSKEESKIDEKPIVISKSDETQSDKIPFFVLFLSFLIGLSLGAGLIGGLFYYKSRVGKVSEKVIPAPIVSSSPELAKSPEATSSASPLSKTELSKYTVQILNGSGISREATKIEPLIRAIGFTTIKTANASKFDYKETEISIKKGVDISVIGLIKTALKGYKVKEIETPSTTYDVLITVGSSKE